MFNEQQVRQFYVVENVATGNTEVTNASAKGTAKLKIFKGEEFAFLYKGPSEDGLQRSDLVKKCNIMDIRLTDAIDMRHRKHKLEITLDEAVSATPVVGQPYVLNVNVNNYIANGDDSTKVKFGCATATNTNVKDLFKKLAISLASNFNREAVPLIKFYLKAGNTLTEVTAKSKFEDFASVNATAIVMEEVEQPWRRGVAKQEFVNFEAFPGEIYVNGIDQKWGKVTDVTASNTNFIPNSKAVADMEWFFHKERGDQYGEQGYPNNIDTVYQVDPANAEGYSFLDIHFYYEGNSMNVGRSEKTMTLVGTKANLKALVGSPATTGENPTAATGLYQFLEGTGITIKTSKNWD